MRFNLTISSKERLISLGRNLVLAALFSILFSADAAAMARKPRTFPIHIKVDFGPAGKPLHEEKLYVEKGTTPKEAVSQVFPVLSGKACCSPRELIAIDGVKIDPAKNRWWTCVLNGSKKFSPQKKKLKSGDRLEWKYVEEAQ